MNSTRLQCGSVVFDCKFIECEGDSYPEDSGILAVTQCPSGENHHEHQAPKANMHVKAIAAMREYAGRYDYFMRTTLSTYVFWDRVANIVIHMHQHNLQYAGTIQKWGISDTPDGTSIDGPQTRTIYSARLGSLMAEHPDFNCNPPEDVCLSWLAKKVYGDPDVEFEFMETGLKEEDDELGDADLLRNAARTNSAPLLRLKYLRIPVEEAWQALEVVQ